MRELRPELRCALKAAASTGESPVWAADEQALYWIDIQQPALHRFVPATGEDTHRDMPSEIGCFALRADGRGAVLGLRDGLYGFTFGGGEVRKLLPPPFDPRHYRFNEGACDSRGRFWLGMMTDPKDGTDPKTLPQGPWHSYTETQGLVAHPHFAEIANGIAWEDGETRMFLSRTEDGTIWRAPYDAEAGATGAPALFARIPPALGGPDGAALDTEGFYWTALHGGGRLRRFAPDGGIERDILLPVSMPTMCAFGGPDLGTLFITTARVGLSAGQLAREPLAGSILAFEPGAKGRILPGFGKPRD